LSLLASSNSVKLSFSRYSSSYYSFVNLATNSSSSCWCFNLSCCVFLSKIYWELTFFQSFSAKFWVFRFYIFEAYFYFLKKVNSALFFYNSLILLLFSVLF
jgi:hypothetical protein